jgi:hypothetical protein
MRAVLKYPHPSTANPLDQSLMPIWWRYPLSNRSFKLLFHCWFNALQSIVTNKTTNRNLIQSLK